MRTRTTKEKPGESSATMSQKRVDDAAEITDAQLDQVTGGIMKSSSDTQGGIVSNVKAS
jgi:hypothetical protein